MLMYIIKGNMVSLSTGNLLSLICVYVGGPYRNSNVQRTVLPLVSCTIVSGVLLYIYIQGFTR